MDSSMEIRKISKNHINRLAQILDDGDSWKRLMSIIPKKLEKENFACDLKINNLPLYNSDHFRMIENGSVRLRRSCTAILFAEWGSTGRIRPAIGHLLYLLKKAELYRAADYVAVNMLNEGAPERPTDGPAAPVIIPNPEATQYSIESFLNGIEYNTSDFNNIAREETSQNSSDTIENNLECNVGPHILKIPKIVITEISNQQVVIEHKRTKPTEVSDMIKFSVTRVPEEVLNITSNSNNSESGNNLPAFSQIMTEENAPIKSEENVPDLNVSIGNGNNTQSCNIPHVSALMQTSKESLESANIPQLDALMEHNESNEQVSIPQISMLMKSESVSEHSLPEISDLLNTQESNDGASCNLPLINTLLNNSIQENVTENNIPQISALLNNTNETSEPVNMLRLNNESGSNIPCISNLMKSVSAENVQEVSNEGISLNALRPNSSESVNSEIPQILGVNLTTSSNNNSRPTCSSPLPNLSLNTLLPHFSYAELEVATNNFDNAPHKNSLEIENSLDESNGRFLGSGAFGSVYLALGILNKPIAVKKLHLNEGEVVNVDDAVTKQFRNEVEILSKYEHENLLSICGYSCDGPTYCLIYDYISGGALNYRLEKYKEKLHWEDRFKIAQGTADAVAYLHTAFNTPLIHRDIKTANILLDCSNTPKLGDFGIIKLSPNLNTTVSTTIIGTTVYMAPEAFRAGDVSIKTDSFSFGVVLLELLTALPPFDENREARDLISHVDDACEDGLIAPLLDLSAGVWLKNDINIGQELYKISSKCLEEKKKRLNMVEVRDLLYNLTN